MSTRSAVAKRCSKCGESKSLSDFHRAPNTKDGRTARCKTCRSEDSAVYRKRRARVEAEALELRRRGVRTVGDNAGGEGL
jgi:hypothetical protein